MWRGLRTNNLHARFKAIKEHTKKWNFPHLSNINEKIELLEKEQEVQDNLGATDEAKLEISLKLEHLYKIKSSMLYQKARSNWQLMGEKNTQFFHKAIKRRSAHNQILGLQVNDAWITSPNDIKKELLCHFKALLGSNALAKVF